MVDQLDAASLRNEQVLTRKRLRLQAMLNVKQKEPHPDEAAHEAEEVALADDAAGEVAEAAPAEDAAAANGASEAESAAATSWTAAARGRAARREFS